MKRSPIIRTTPLRRKTRMRWCSRKRRKERHERDFGAQAERCRTLPCTICGRRPAEPHHEPTRAAGGRDKDTLPLCRDCHDERHAIGRPAFEAKHRRDLRAAAAGLYARIKGHTG